MAKVFGVPGVGAEGVSQALLWRPRVLVWRAWASARELRPGRKRKIGSPRAMVKVRAAESMRRRPPGGMGVAGRGCCRAGSAATEMS